jgi:hypothetical protein
VRLDLPRPSGKSICLVDFAPVFFICRFARDITEAGEKPLSKAVNRIDRKFLNDLTTARSDVKAEETLYRYQIGSADPFMETVVPGAGLVGGREPSLERVLCISKKAHLF